MKPKYIALEIRKSSGDKIAFWACDVDNPACAYSMKFDFRDTSNDENEALRMFFEWVKRRSAKSSSLVSFVVWEKNDLTVLLSRRMNFVCNWIDFFSFYAGTNGLTMETVRENFFDDSVLKSLEIDSAQKLAHVFVHTLNVSEKQQLLVASATELRTVVDSFNADDFIVEVR